MEELVAGLAVLSCTLFTGAALYISLVEHPARLACRTEVAFAQWAPSYERATITQVSLAIVAAAAGVTCWAWGRGDLWLWGALLIFSVMPFTVIFIFPTNKKLLAPGGDPSSAETRSLLRAWGRLHAVRSALSLVASLLFVVAVLRT